MATLPVRRSGRNPSTLVNPSREFEDIYDRMGQLMNFAFGDLARVEMPWVPLADLSETEDAYVAKVELPGVGKDQIDVQLQDRELVVSGEIPEQEQDGQDGQNGGQNGGRRRRHRSTRRTGRFEFRAWLPGDVNADAVQGELTDGVLTLTIPKSEAAKPRKIEIKG
jgi:HSP20 family protein